MKDAIKNFHLPLPQRVYDALREEAASLRRPATVVAREAIEAWLRERKRAGVRAGGRPVIIVSHDGFNEVPTWRSVIVVPVSTSETQARRGPTAVLLATGVGGLRAPSVALCHQVTTLDRAKLSERLGMLPHGALIELQDGLRMALDLD